MLEAPRMLLDRALLPLNPLEPPLNPLDREELPEEKSRLPILLLLALAPRLPPADWVEAPARLPAADEPRDEPENLSAVALFE
jgi:hypothetical protein